MVHLFAGHEARGGDAHEEHAGHQLRERTVQHRGVDTLVRGLHLDDEAAEEAGEADEVQDDEEVVNEFHGFTLAERRAAKPEPRVHRASPGTA